MKKNILIVSDKFKGSLSSLEVGRAISDGLQDRNNYDIEIQPIADGGDGTLEVFQYLLPYKTIEVKSYDPRRNPISAHYLRHLDTAVIEMAIASGITLLNDQLSPMLSDAYGTGILIRHAVENGAKEVIIGLGGSCSTEGGTSILEGMGFKFYDKDRNLLKMNGQNMIRVQEIEPPDYKWNVNYTLLSDVRNIMCGLQGAAYIYGAQKGANKEQVKKLDEGLKNLCKIILNRNSIDVSMLQGAGAAGGAGGGLSGLLGAKIENGFNYINHISHLEHKVQNADIIITGEGQLDRQSLSGKVVGQLAEMTTLYQKPLYCIVGKNTLTPSEISEAGITGIHSLMECATDLSDAIEHAYKYTTVCASNLEF